MNYWMLLWNPKESLSEQDFKTWIEEENGAGNWSVGNLPVKPGDRCFIRRCRKHPGIVTYGDVTGEPYLSDHWHFDYGTEKDQQKPYENFADVALIKASLEQPILVNALKLLGFAHLPWRNQHPTPLSRVDGEALQAICDAMWKSDELIQNRMH
jgi:hypothetical protein